MRFTAILKGTAEDGSKTHDRLNLSAKDKATARGSVKSSLIDDEKIVYIGPEFQEDGGDELNPAHG